MSDAAEVITATRCGRTFRDNRRGVAHLDYTLEQLAHDAPTCQLRIIQPPYSTGVAASAGTHDLGGVYDVEIVGMSWSNAQGFLRRCGWAAWWRQPPTFSNHIHMVSLGYPAQVGVYVPGQVADYYQHRTGLAGHAADASWFPADIGATVFDFPAWQKELHVDESTLRRIIREEFAAELDRAVEVKRGETTKKRSLRQMVKEVWAR